MEMPVEHDVIAVDEFDALAVEVKSSTESEPTKFPAKLHARKVAAQLNVRDGLIYLPGEPTRTYEDSDMGPDFRQRRYFYYITGANFADCAVTYEIRRDRLILWIPFVEPRQILWFGSTPGIIECLKRYDVDDVRYISQLDKFFDRVVTPDTTVYLLHGDQAPAAALGWHGKVRVDTRQLMPAMDEARVVKSEYEVAMIRKANDISSTAHRKVAEQLLWLTNEAEMEVIFRGSCAVDGAKMQSYPVIAGAGVNASTLHYWANDQPLKGKQLVVLDAGCEFDCYASDITRTMPLSGRFSAEAKAVHDIVARMQNECISYIRPGVNFYSLTLHAYMVATDGLLRLGILKGTASEILAAGTVAAFFPHGLGHHVGLEVHDVAGRAALLASGQDIDIEGGKRKFIGPATVSAMAQAAKAGQAPPNQRGFQKNMIITIEPGIYFCRQYIEGYFLAYEKHAKFIDRDVLEGYYDVGGVRIEDDILVTENGHENLSPAAKGQALLDIINGRG